MLSNISRWLTYLCALLYGVLGAILFILPEQMAPAFAWTVTAFMTMTIGGWCLGNAWLAYLTARRWTWGLVYTSLIYLWLFGIGELLVLFSFRDKLVLQHPVAWLYLITLLVNVLAAIVGVVDWLRLKPANLQEGPLMSALPRFFVIGFMVFVGFLGLYGTLAPLGAPGTNGGIFPELMSAFTLRSFGVFYLTLALAVIPLLREHSLRVFLHHGIASYGLIIIITAAAFIYLRLFDFINRPGGLAYFGAYLAVGIPLLFIFRKMGTGLRPQ